MVANQDDSGVAPDAVEVGGSVPAAKRILFYYPSNKRTVALETLILDVHRRGVHIEVLTTCEAGAFHAYLAEHGVPVHTHAVPKKISLYYYVRQILHLAKLCRSHGITVVFSNLQHANFIAVFAQFLMPARVITFRHHVHGKPSSGRIIPLSSPSRVGRGSPVRCETGLFHHPSQAALPNGVQRQSECLTADTRFWVKCSTNED